LFEILFWRMPSGDQAGCSVPAACWTSTPDDHAEVSLIVNHRRHFIFYHVPKAAGTSVRTALLEVPGSRKPRGTKHWTPEEYQKRIGWLGRFRVRNYFTFCFVRDPFERFGSSHRYALQIGKPLPQDVNEAAAMLADGKFSKTEWRSIIPQVEFATGRDFVGRYENLENDLKEIERRMGVTLTLQKLNTSGAEGSYRRLFTSRTMDILAARYAADFREFGYKPE